MTVAYVLCAVLVHAEHEDIVTNSRLLLIAVSSIGGQGATMIWLACIQAMLDFHTIVCSHIINGVLISYFIGADTIVMSITNGLFPETNFGKVVIYIAIINLIVQTITAIKIDETKDAAGMKAKSNALSKGIYFKKNLLPYLAGVILFAGTVIFVQLNKNYVLGAGAVIILAVLGVNLILPIYQAWKLDINTVNDAIGYPSMSERMMSNKGVDLEFSTVVKRPEFWFYGFTFAIVFGISRMIVGNSDELLSHNEDAAEEIKQVYQLFEIAGCALTSVRLQLLRKIS
jgi:hypothetical protein